MSLSVKATSMAVTFVSLFHGIINIAKKSAQFWVVRRGSSEYSKGAGAATILLITNQWMTLLVSLDHCLHLVKSA